ncbi:hypothetical protein LRR80_02615 [Streptomyces sp. RO-S4]|uniref:hypothetical protein n=1 Tax=unclassified Streptomyces TaxID=2593676 RepID=UPI00208F9398|nr:MULTISPECIES: hypothetical protein [unclassified Streptomyces]MCO4696556.1 hypothetical protein [Streptomyces sp. RO-S4]MDU0301783.1 hypothetical protein [Streptomyces sp. PAL114]
MSVVWSATSLESGYFDGLGRHTSVEQLTSHLAKLRTLGRGHVEVLLPGSDFPALTLSFQGDHAVVHLFADSDVVHLHTGDGTVAPDSEVEVPVMDELACFTGAYVLGTDHACGVVCEFVRAGRLGSPGDWQAV